MTELSCEELHIPPRLWRNNRIRDDRFNNGAEYLYRRFPPDVKITPEGRLSGATIKDAISPPFNISCNRSSMCEHPTDVLYNIKQLPHRFHYGVMKATIDSIKDRTLVFKEGKELTTLRFGIEHKPETCMYPHSEITIYKNEIKIDKASKTNRTLIRDELAKAFIVCHKPDPDFVPIEKEHSVLTRIRKAVENLFNPRFS